MISDALKETDYLENNNDVIQLKRSHKYYYQLAVTGLRRGYFCVWTGKGQPHIETILVDAAWWFHVEQKLILFFVKVTWLVAC